MFHLFFGNNALLHIKISIFRPTKRMFRWFVSILGALFTNTIRRINVNDTLLGDQLSQFLRANANTMILTFCLVQTLFSYHPLILLPPFWSTRFLSEDHQNRKIAVPDQQNPVCLPTVPVASHARPSPSLE